MYLDHHSLNHQRLSIFWGSKLWCQLARKGDHWFSRIACVHTITRTEKLTGTVFSVSNQWTRTWPTRSASRRSAETPCFAYVVIANAGRKWSRADTSVEQPRGGVTKNSWCRACTAIVAKKKQLVVSYRIVRSRAVEQVSFIPSALQPQAKPRVPAKRTVAGNAWMYAGKCIESVALLATGYLPNRSGWASWA